MNLITDKGPFNIDLRQACIAIAIFILVSITFGVLILPGTISHSTTLLGFVIRLLGNAALLYGALKDNQWFVLVWLIQELLFFIGWPIGVLGVIFNFGGYRQAAGSNSVWVVLIIYIIDLIFNAYCTRLVYSYYKQLSSRTASPQHAVVV